MTIILTPEKALAVEKAIEAGLISNPDEIVDAWLEGIKYRMPSTDARPLPATAEEWKRELREWIESHSPVGPPLPDDAFSRECIYEDRGW